MIKINKNAGPLIITMFVILAGVFWLLSPILSIWSLNTLFRLQIPLDFATYASAFWIHLVINSIVKRESQ